MKTRILGYWVSTGIIAFAFLGGGIADLAASPEVTASLNNLGYPPYLATILGVWKLLGAVAILAPRFPRLKEWAYAGMLFDLSGAALSHGFVGDPVGAIAIPLVLLGVVFASWALRPESRKLPSHASTVSPRPHSLSSSAPSKSTLAPA